jgi:hypothetical protein
MELSDDEGLKIKKDKLVEGQFIGLKAEQEGDSIKVWGPSNAVIDFLATRLTIQEDLGGRKCLLETRDEDPQNKSIKAPLQLLAETGCEFVSQPDAFGQRNIM